MSVSRSWAGRCDTYRCSENWAISARCSHAGWDGSQTGDSSSEPAAPCCHSATLSPQRSWSEGDIASGKCAPVSNLAAGFTIKLYHEEQFKAVQTWLHNVPIWMMHFHLQQTSAQLSRSRTFKYWNICRENNKDVFHPSGWKQLSFLMSWERIKAKLVIFQVLWVEDTDGNNDQ